MSRPHIVIASESPWGHARPLCGFAAKVVLARNIYVTLFTFPRIIERVKNEISRWFVPQDADRLNFIRIVALDCVAEEAQSFGDRRRREQERYHEAFLKEYGKLLDETPITCFATNIEHAAISSPSVLVLDLMVGPLAKMVRELNKKTPKIVGFCPAMATYMYVCAGPIERGGLALRSKILKEVELSGRSISLVADEMVSFISDELLQITGFPKMYHWELDPQDNSFVLGDFAGAMLIAMFEGYDECDGMIICSPEVYEPDVMAATEEWFAETGREVWAIGPLLPPLNNQVSTAGEEAQSEKAAEIKNFMDDVLEKNGRHSMLYISFGSGFWVSEFEKLEAFVDVVIELRIPFILSHGSPRAQLTDQFREKVKHSGLGLLSTWSPQQTILLHPATGWFVSHCGQNSTLEAISSGIPMICWPLYADQPLNAINLTLNHDVAYELLEVRSGPNGLKPIHRHLGKVPTGTLKAVQAEAKEVLEKAFGEDGVKKRAKAEALRRKVNDEWEKGGRAYEDMQMFLSTF
ncbi:hypothetical protein EIP91_000099 [Steccherinum ochraceum]|uniref:UDP-glycosyltransferases domain-containing protein n=1 Tax=Steccherinum ochraceum TaxID=92696 RepID=A0A4V2MXZ2_9APHY|nr:hypothetical protein EIP91_000099 [Steccherinum ochraceum]